LKICVALDLSSKKENLALLEKIKDFDVWIKVGFRSYIRDGKEFLADIKQINPNFKIFLDLKLYDIPNTMADAAEEIAALGVDMFNIHASAGKKAMQEVMNRLSHLPKRPLVLAVTALTSFDEDGFTAVYSKTINEKAAEFAHDAYEAGLDGVVCSAHESELIKTSTDGEFATLCPGIRDTTDDAGDQQRVVDVVTAKSMKVDFAVIGRPIYKSKDPRAVLQGILNRI
jgi:orotidine-5'-phosphate decarboxylase